MNRWSIAGALAGALLLGSNLAFAQDKAAAEALFDEARGLLKAGKAAEACPKFEASQKLDPGIGTLLYLGACYEEVGKTASAWASFREAASLAKQAGQSDREATARQRADALEGKLFKLSIVVPQENRVDGMNITRGGTPVGQSQWGLALPVDPGQTAIVAEAPGYEAWSTNVLVPETAGTQSVTVPALTKAPEAPTPVGPVGPVDEPIAPPPDDGTGSPDESDGSGQRIAGLIIGGVGVAGVAVGAIFGVIALGNDSDADEFCDDTTCFDPEGETLSEDAQSAGNIATIGWIAGPVLMAVGAVVYLTAPDDDDAMGDQATVYLQPVVSPRFQGLALGGQF